MEMVGGTRGDIDQQSVRLESALDGISKIYQVGMRSGERHGVKSALGSNAESRVGSIIINSSGACTR